MTTIIATFEIVYFYFLFLFAQHPLIMHPHMATTKSYTDFFFIGTIN
jgi:hypothetical protein